MHHALVAHLPGKSGHGESRPYEEERDYGYWKNAPATMAT